MRRRQVSRTQTTSLARRFATSSVSKRYFLPSSLPGCQLWLDAADSSSVITTGTNVTTWKDKSGNGYDMNTLTQSATWTGTAVYPTIGTSINGLQTVNFKAQAGLKQGTTLDGVKNLFWVGRIEAPVGSGDVSFFLFGHDTHFDWHSNQYGGRIVHPSLTQTGIYNASPTSLFTSDVNAITNASFSSVNMPSAPNVSLLSVGGITGTTRYQGICYDRNANLGWCGDLAEVITFSTALSTAQRQAVEGYLAHKWGLTKYYSPTTPLSISGCQLWLDAADSTTVTGTTTVTQWRDKSVNNRHLGVRVGGTTYSSNAINLVNSAMFVDSPVNLSNVTMFILAKTTGGNNQTVFTTKSSVSQSYNTLDGFGFYMDGTTSVRLYGQYGGGVPSFATNTSTPKLFSYQSSGTSISVWMNAISQVGATLSSSRTSTAGGFGIGAEWTNEDGGRFQNFYVNASIYEIIVYNTVLTITQRETIEKYLMQKWGLGLLPLSHPYANYIPSPLTQFIPKSITGCGLWMDAADIGTFSFSSGSNISTWIDKSGNGRNMSVFSTSYPVLVNNAQNGNSVIAFAGVASQYLRTTSNSILINEHSRFIVYSTTAVVSGAAVLSSDDGSSGIGGFFVQGGGGGGTYQDYLGWPTDTGDQGPFQTGSTYRIGEAIITTTPNINGEVYFNGTLKTPFFNVTSSPVKQTTRILIGSRGDVGFTGRVAEFLTYDRVITTTERQEIEGYLAWKWGLTGSLPAGHPYKTFSPFPVISINFLPTLIPGCVLWLDAADQTSMTLSGSNVTQWRDKSGNGRNATGAGTPTYSSSSFNGKSGITLNGSPQSFTGSLTNTSNTVTVFTVFNYTTFVGNDQRIVSLGGPGQHDYTNAAFCVPITTYGTTPNRLATSRNQSTKSDFGPITLGSLFLTSTVYNGIDGRLYVNGTLSSYGAPTSSTENFGYSIYAIGTAAGGQSTDFFRGVIAEVIIYHTALSTSERQQVESYLAWKWALQTSLPSDHTYKFAAPSV